MKAEITYNGGKSCQVYGVTFKEGIMRVSENPDVIRRCQETAGFAVHLLKSQRGHGAQESKKDAPQKVIVPVVAAVNPPSKVKKSPSNK